MNRNKIVEFQTKKSKGLFISVPYNVIVEKCEFISLDEIKIIHPIKNYKGEFIDSINRMTIPKGYNKIVGLSNKLTEKQMSDELGLSYHEYLRFLDENEITVNYSDTSNYWLVVVLN